MSVSVEDYCISGGPKKRVLEDGEADPSTVVALLKYSQRAARVGGWQLDIKTNRLLWTDETYRIHDTNPEEFDPTVDAGVGYFLPESREIISHALERAVTEGVGYALELETYTTKGRLIEVFTTCEVTFEDGKPSKLTGIFQDITERKETERKLIQSQKMETVSRLSSGLAHDFNNLLGIITCSLELLLFPETNDAHDKLTAEQIDHLKTALGATARGGAITKRMLSVSKQGAARVAPSQVLNLNRVIDEASELIRGSLGSAFDIVVETSNAPCLARIDQSEFENVLLNFALNSRDAMPKGGQLKIRLVPLEAGEHESKEPPVGSWCRVEFEDNGPGVPSELLDRVFEPFFTTKDSKGTGLGLAMASTFADHHGGKVSVRNVPTGGACFAIDLPVTAEETKVEIHQTVQTSPEGEREIVLVVDDDENLARVIAIQLKNLGYETLVVTSASDALRILETDQPIDLVLSDIMMPGDLSGNDLADLAQQMRPKLPIVLMSGVPGSLDESLRVTFLQKPIDRAALAASVRETLDRVGRQR